MPAMDKRRSDQVRRYGVFFMSRQPTPRMIRSFSSRREAEDWADLARMHGQEVWVETVRVDRARDNPLSPGAMAVAVGAGLLVLVGAVAIAAAASKPNPSGGGGAGLQTVVSGHRYQVVVTCTGPLDPSSVTPQTGVTIVSVTQPNGPDSLTVIMDYRGPTGSAAPAWPTGCTGTTTDLGPIPA